MKTMANQNLYISDSKFRRCPYFHIHGASTVAHNKRDKEIANEFMKKGQQKKKTCVMYVVPEQTKVFLLKP